MKGGERLSAIFDGTIILNNPTYGFLDKMRVYELSPFEETIFLDADMNIISDISFLFDDFKKNGSDISVVGEVRTINEKQPPIHFNENTMQRFNFNKCIAFGGGIYYFQKTLKAQECMDFIMTDLIPNYEEYGLNLFPGGRMADEPLYEVGMQVYGFQPLNSSKEIMRYHYRMMSSFEWDLKKQECSFIWYGKIVHPHIAHYAIGNTYTRKYVFYNSQVRSKYFGRNSIMSKLHLLKDYVVLFYRQINNKDCRKDAWDWFKAHFTKRYMQFTKQRLIRIFKGNPEN